MIPSCSSPTTTGAGKPPTASDLLDTSQKANVDTYKTPGLDNPETDSSAAKPLGAYSIQSSDDQSEDNDIEALLLRIDECLDVDMNKNAQAKGLVSCLFLVHVPDKGEEYVAWHIAGADLCYLLDKKMRQMHLILGGEDCRKAVKNADNRADEWKETVQKNPGTTYLCGPSADEQAREFFNIDAVNVTRTGEGPVSPTFDIATRSFHIISHRH